MDDLGLPPFQEIPICITRDIPIYDQHLWDPSKLFWQHQLVTGAPVMESSTGQFVAGHRRKRLASASTLPDGGRGESVDEQQVESFWRVEEQHAAKKPDSVPATDVVSSGPPSPVVVSEEKSQPGAVSDGKGKGQCVAELEGEKVDPPNGEHEGDGVEQPDDDIPMGYSPGSTCPTSSATNGSIPVKCNKYDKYYHQSLVCNNTA